MDNPALREARQSKDEAILVLLGKLALHYWRPDFTPGQAKRLYRDYVEDLRELPMAEIDMAMRRYRMNGANRFFPTTGALIDLILGKADLERDNPGAPDRAQTLYRIKNGMQAEGAAEVARIALQIGGTTPKQIAAE